MGQVKRQNEAGETCKVKHKRINSQKENRHQYTTSSLGGRQSQEPEDQLLAFFTRKCIRELTLLERQVQVEKAKLVVRQDYSAEACLSTLNLQASTRLSENELYHLLTRLGIPCSSRDTQLLIKRFDADEDGRLTCLDVLQMLQPNDQTLLEKRPSKEGLSVESINTLKSLLTLVMETEERAERIRSRLREATKDLRGLFDKCDYLGRAQLTEIEINQLLRTHPAPE